MKVKNKKSKTYQCWQDMQQRCYNPNCKKYSIYGARGIKVCDRWLESFSNFLEDMGEKPDGFSIDRIDNNGDYSPENCKWATPKEQALNRRTNRFIEYNGERLTVTQWADKLGMVHNVLRKRLELGWTLEKALSSARYNAKCFTEDEKELILKDIIDNKLTQHEAAQKYKVSQGAISKWKLRKDQTWQQKMT